VIYFNALTYLSREVYMENSKELSRFNFGVLKEYFGKIVSSSSDKPTIRDASIFFSVITILFVTLGYIIQKKYSLAGVFVSEIAILLIPVILFIKLKNFSYKKVLRLNKVNIPLLLLSSGILLFSLPIVTIINLIYAAIIKAIFGKFIASAPPIYSGISGMFISFFIITITPAIIEELVFRGIISSGFEKYGKKWSIFFSGVLFALMHCDFQKLPGIIILGMILAWLAYRANSIYCSMSAHFTNNFLALFLMILYEKSTNLNAISSAASQEMQPEMLEGPLAYFIVFGFIVLLIYAFCSTILFVMYKEFIKRTAPLVVTNDKNPIDFKKDGLIWLVPGIATIIIVYLIQGIEMLNINIPFFS